jgi:hypothetical protein
MSTNTTIHNQKPGGLDWDEGCVADVIRDASDAICRVAT